MAEVQQRVWARTYARAIAGTPINMSFAIESPLRHFELCFAFGTRNAGFGGSYATTTTSSDPAAETEIFASQSYHYPNGLRVHTTANLLAAVPPPCVSSPSPAPLHSAPATHSSWS